MISKLWKVTYARDVRNGNDDREDVYMSKGHGCRVESGIDEVDGCAPEYKQQGMCGVDVRNGRPFLSGILKLWIQIEEEVAKWIRYKNLGKKSQFRIAKGLQKGRHFCPKKNNQGVTIATMAHLKTWEEKGKRAGACSLGRQVGEAVRRQTSVRCEKTDLLHWTVPAWNMVSGQVNRRMRSTVGSWKEGVL